MHYINILSQFTCPFPVIDLSGSMGRYTIQRINGDFFIFRFK